MTMRKTTVHQEGGRKSARIFISYAADDRVPATKIRKFLTDHLGARVFSDDLLSAGEDWMSKLKREISRCDIFVVLVSPSSLAASSVLNELGAAWALDKPIVPVIIEPAALASLPVELEGVQALDLDAFAQPESVRQLFLGLLESPSQEPLLLAAQK